MFKSTVSRALYLVGMSWIFCVQAQPLQPLTIPDTLKKAAEEFNVKLSPKSYAAGTFGNGVYEGAFIEGFETTPVTAYGSGVDYAIVRYSSTEVKDDYYKARIVPLSAIKRLGKTAVTVQLITKDGTIVHSNKSTPTIFSLTVASDAHNFSPSLEFSGSLPGRKSITSARDFGGIEVLGTACCTNGMCGICIGRGCPAN